MKLSDTKTDKDKTKPAKPAVAKTASSKSRAASTKSAVAPDIAPVVDAPSAVDSYAKPHQVHYAPTLRRGVATRGEESAIHETIVMLLAGALQISMMR